MITISNDVAVQKPCTAWGENCQNATVRTPAWSSDMERVRLESAAKC
jgi:hypothetical protein